MSTETLTVPSLRARLLDCIDIGYWTYQTEIEECAACAKHPAGVCADPEHQAANIARRECEDARKLIEQRPSHPDVLAVFAGLEVA